MYGLSRVLSGRIFVATLVAQRQSSPAIVHGSVYSYGGWFHIVPYLLRAYPARAYNYHTVSALVYARGLACIIISMPRQKSKRRQRIHLTFVYTLMVVAVVSIVTVLVLVIQGYRYNRFDGRLEQGGLVQFNSKPSGAVVTVDDVTLSNKTASKVTLTSGRHTITMARDGYSSWRKDVLVKPGGVLWLNYARLFPNTPQIDSVAQFSQVSSTLPSPSKRLIAVVGAATSPEVSLVDIDSDKPVVRKVAIPAASYTAPEEGQVQSFALINWDKDSNLLLVKHTYGDKSEYLSLDTRNATATNITTELGVDIASIDYSLGDSNVLYALTTTHELRRLNLGSATVSGPLALGVSSFNVAENRVIAYETLPDSKGMRSVGYVSSGSNVSKPIASYHLANDAPLRVVTGNYYGDHYVAVLRGELVEILKGDLPSSDSSSKIDLESVASLMIAGGGDYLGFAPGANRMIYVASDKRVVTYDLELRTNATITLQTPLVRDVQWLDGYHILATGPNSYYYDYDGTNGQLFASNTLDLPAALSSSEK